MTLLPHVYDVATLPHGPRRFAVRRDGEVLTAFRFRYSAEEEVERLELHLFDHGAECPSVAARRAHRTPPPAEVVPDFRPPRYGVRPVAFPGLDVFAVVDLDLEGHAAIQHGPRGDLLAFDLRATALHHLEQLEARRARTRASA